MTRKTRIFLKAMDMKWKVCSRVIKASVVEEMALLLDCGRRTFEVLSCFLLAFIDRFEVKAILLHCFDDSC